jgi:hypothetical protein
MASKHIYVRPPLLVANLSVHSPCTLYWRPAKRASIWGAESWNLSKQNLNKLNVFHHSAIRWILGINMEKVKNERIKNTSIRKAFCNILPVEYYIKRRVWNFIGKIVRQEHDHLPKKLMGAWIRCPRKTGQPQKSCRNLAVSTLRMMIPEMSKEGKFNEFFKLTKDENVWKNILKQHEEAFLESANNTEDTDTHLLVERDSSFMSIEDEEHISMRAYMHAQPLTGP